MIAKKDLENGLNRNGVIGIEQCYDLFQYDLEKLNNFIFSTPHTASPMILLLILDMPSSLSLNTMGTSLSLKPNVQAANFISI